VGGEGRVGRGGERLVGGVGRGEASGR